MANTVNLKFTLSDDGTIAGATARVKQLNSELAQTKKLAPAAMKGAGENIEYGRGRGAMGATGAGARDFANEAQGLGGLVRLYATYAANLFAVTAAFQALREAMDTTNMIKGLDQLGAATGVAMGGLAKRFTEASGGAISLRESMEATAKAMSSGMSQKQFLQLGEVAKKASQALGVSMSDAVSRLTRGITKLEPELLDELGLFTKVGKASEDYARSIGKSVDNLTDFEKRQAFANAVLKEGTDKFAEINIPTNPYDKLLANLKNVAQTILEVINKGLTPLVSLLSSSPTALTGVVLGLAGLIAKQALPILSKYREEIKRVSELSKNDAQAKAATAKEALDKVRAAQKAEIQGELDKIAEIKGAQVDAAEAALKRTAKSRLSKPVQDILSKPSILAITKEDLLVIDELGKKQTAVAGKYRDLATTIRAAQKANENYIESERKLTEDAKKAPGAFSPAGIAAARAESARKEWASRNLVSQVGETAQTAGMMASLGQLLSGIKTEKLGIIRGGLTGIAGAANIAAVGISNLFTVLGRFLGVISLLTATYEIFNYTLSNNGKEQDRFNEAIANGDEAARALDLTYAKYKNNLNPQAIIATATAFDNLSDSMTATVKALAEADIKASGFDKFIDGFKVAIGKDLKSEFSRSLAFQITSGLKGISDPALRKEAETRLKELLNVSSLTALSVENAVAAIDKSKIIKTGEDVATVFENTAVSSKKAAGSLTDVENGFKALSVSYTELSNSLVAKDALSNFARDITMQGFKLEEVFKDPIASAATLRDILGDISKMKLLPPEAQQALIQGRNNFNNLSNQASVFEREISDAEDKVRELDDAISKSFVKGALKQQRRQAVSQAETARANLSDVQGQMTQVAKDMSVVTSSAIALGFKLIQVEFATKMAEGVLNAQKSLLDKLPKTAETAMLGADIENQKIDLQIKQITTTERLIKEMELGRIQDERIHLENQRDRALEQEKEPGIRSAITTAAEKQIAPLRDREKLLQSKNIAKDIASGAIKKTPESFIALQQQQGTLAKVQQLADQKQLNTLNAVVEAESLRYDKQKQFFQDSLKDVEARKKQYQASEEFRNSTLEQQQASIANLVDEETILQRQLALVDTRKELGVATIVQQVAEQKGWDKINIAAQAGIDKANAQLTVNQKNFDINSATATAETNRANTLALQQAAIVKNTIELEKQAAILKIIGDTEISSIGMDKELLNIQLEQGKILIDAYNEQILALEKIERLKQRDLKLAAIEQQYLTQTAGLLKEYSEATTETKKEEIRLRLQASSAVYQAEITGITELYNKQEAVKSQIEFLTDRQKSYADIFKKTFEGMADAIVDFVKTGKLDFKGLIDSMLTDLLRYELRLQALALYQAVRPGLMNFLPNIFGGGNAAGNTMYDAGLNQMAPQAKGGVFDAGVKMFAKGGTFTNGIVDSPTLFKFAKGTGLMGEAGPEAIMPLKRDSNGNLGVRADSQRTEVVVNNYSGERAEARETTDSRGNRRIEVTVGDMTAAEISRTGSGPQKAIRNTFGIQPKLIRR